MDTQERRDELTKAIGYDAQLRVLLRNGLGEFLSDDHATSDFLKFAYSNLIEKHQMGLCQCTIQEGGNEYCYISPWYEGDRPPWEFITDRSYAVDLI